MAKKIYKKGFRKCWVCKKIMRIEKFVKERRRKSGYNYICKKCQLKKHKEWRENNPEKTKEWREKDRLYQKIKRLKLRFQIFQRDNFTCQYCGRKVPKVELQVDHKYPKSKGGLNKIENYITACKDCNLGKGDNILKEF